MNKELDEGKKERERLLAFERDVQKRREDSSAVTATTLTRESLLKEIAKVSIIPTRSSPCQGDN
jgi:beclin 1